MSGIEYVVEDLSTHPHCAHGPSLLFSRLISRNEERRKFFACSAYRDRKYCPFFLWEDDSLTDKAKEKAYKRKHPASSDFHKKLFILFNNVQQQEASQRVYCIKCNVFVLPGQKSKHENHEFKDSLTDEQLSNPTTWLEPLVNTKKEAQYLFSDNTVNRLIKILKRLKLKNILCVGCPRVHEHIQNHDLNMTSLLLDIDGRYQHFFGPLQFCYYNLFNNYFFVPNSKQVFMDFLQTDNGEGVAIVMDPPFGGRTEPIAETIKNITERYQTLNQTIVKLPVFLFFPYFMESLILNSLPNFKMSDYKVEYDNHALFNDAKTGRKYGSPVRFFTNMSLSDIQLPKNEYHYCNECSYWVYKENEHCIICNKCTSKDGRTYVHCNTCNRCVKPSWTHCDTCNKCAQVDHKCGEIQFNQECFHCKQRGHKKRDCPQANQGSVKRKRDAKLEKIKSKKK